MKEEANGWWRSSEDSDGCIWCASQLRTIPRAKHHLAKYAELVSTVFPPSTSSPMIRHAAVCIMRELRSSTVIEAMARARDTLFATAGYATDLCA